MKRSLQQWQKLVCSSCLLFLVAFPLMAQKNKTTNQPPNLVLIIADQWRGQALGYRNLERVKTPFLDSLSAHALTITQMVSNFPVCSPARAMLMTGKYPFRNNVFSNVNSASAPFGVELPINITCWSDILKRNGYSNGYIGKWHLDSPHPPYIPTSNNKGSVAWNEWTPPERRHGFDYWYAYGTYDVHNRPMYWNTNAQRDGFHYVDQWGPEHEADRAIAYFKNSENLRAPGKPFSLVVSMNPPHSDYTTFPKRYLKDYQDVPLSSLLTDPNIPPAGTPMGDEYRKHIKNYYANITGVDEQIGRIVHGLKETKLLDNTIIIITSDHGNCLGKHNEITKNNIYEESISIPFLVYWNGKIQPGVDSSFLGSLPDVFPTILELMGLKKEIPSDLDGKSYAEYFLNRKGKTPKEQFIMGSIVSNKVQGNSGFRGIRTQAYKLAYQKKGKEVTGFLFDLKNDPFELNNLYDPTHPKVIEMDARLSAWLQRTNDPFTLVK